MLTKLSARRAAAAVATAVLPLSLLGLAAAPSQAAVVGHLVAIPSTGTTISQLDIETLVPCPATSVYLSVEWLGAGINPDTGNNIVNGNASLATYDTTPSGGYHVPINGSVHDVFQAYNITAPSGIYTLSAACYDNNLQLTGRIEGQFQFTPTAGSFNATYVQLSNGESTTTALGVTPADPVTSGTQSTLTATVTPSNAVGQVQFKRNGTNVGAAVTVASGTAGLTIALPAGTGTLTAQFVPTDSDAFQSSTSAGIEYVVAGPASLTGTAAVGAKLTCAITAGGTIGYTWMAAGSPIAGVTTRDVTVPAAWLGKSITCKATVTKGATSVQQTSAAKTIALGVALKATTKPSISGIFKVGKKLTGKHGTWSPAATTYTYKWLRNGKAIKGATKATYKLTAADKGKKISLRVTATKAGYANGVATSAAKKVS